VNCPKDVCSVPHPPIKKLVLKYLLDQTPRVFLGLSAACSDFALERRKRSLHIVIIKFVVVELVYLSALVRGLGPHLGRLHSHGPTVTTPTLLYGGHPTHVYQLDDGVLPSSKALPFIFLDSSRRSLVFILLPLLSCSCFFFLALVGYVDKRNILSIFSLNVFLAF